MHKLTPHLVCELIIALGFITATACCIVLITRSGKADVRHAEIVRRSHALGHAGFCRAKLHPPNALQI